MPRQAHATDFFVEVDRLGRFNFARRTIEDTFKIRGQYHQITSGYYDDDGNMCDLGALSYVTVRALLVSGPENFDIDQLDPLVDDEVDSKLVAIWRALREKELSFRPKARVIGAGGGAEAGANLPALVSEAVQSRAD
jgi:hypothetical protein